MIYKDFLPTKDGLKSFLASRYPLFLHGHVVSGVGEGTDPDHAARLQDIAVLKAYADASLAALKSYVDQAVASAVSGEKTVFLDEHTAFYRISPGEKVVPHLGCASVAVLLPSVVHPGEKFAVLGSGSAGGWSVIQNDGQQILFGNNRTTAGAAGMLKSTTGASYLRLCVVSSGLLVVESSSAPVEIL